MATSREGVVVLLEDPCGRMAMQLRDNGSRTSYAGQWGLFGGWMAKGEEPAAAAIREIMEELGCQLASGKLNCLTSLGLATVGVNSTTERATTHVFHYPVSGELQGAVLKEGKDFRFFYPEEFEALEIVPHHRAILEWHSGR